MIKIGILPSTNLNKKDNPYNDTYTFYNVYSKKIYQAGAIPIGLLLTDGKLNIEALDICDAFIICGGSKIEEYFIETIYYAIKRNKPLLGICLGMQAIGVYSYLETLLEEENKQVTIQNLTSKYKQIKEEKTMFLKPIEGHYNEKITRTNFRKNKHSIKISTNSKIYKIYKKENITVVSMHRYTLNKYGKNILINCTYDNTIEGIEYKNKDLFIIGVQWHPELEEENLIMFKSLIDEAKRRKNAI